MDDLLRRWGEPDEHVEFGEVTEDLISIGGLTVSRSVQPAGWHWREHFQPLVGGEWCMAHHVGVTLTGRQGIELPDGSVVEYGPGDLYDVPPGHGGWAIGDQDCVMLERFGGRRITTTGDGLLASFDATAAAVRCAIAIRDLAERQALAIRTDVHVGEVELAGEDVRGMTVHEAARIMGAARGGEILVSDAVAILSRPAGIGFEDAGDHELKGVAGIWHLSRLVG